MENKTTKLILINEATRFNGFDLWHSLIIRTGIETKAGLVEGLNRTIAYLNCYPLTIQTIKTLHIYNYKQ